MSDENPVLPPDYESRLRALAAQIESALKPDLAVAYGSREHLLDELTGRLRNSAKPDRLLRAWEKNASTYAARANLDAMNQRKERNLRPDIDLDVDPAFIDRQFGLCGEICPPPVASSKVPVGTNSSSDESGGMMSG